MTNDNGASANNKLVRFNVPTDTDGHTHEPNERYGEHTHDEPEPGKGCKGLTGIYVDDLVMKGDEEFERKSEKLDREINMKDAVLPPATFAGIQIEK